MKTRKYRYDPAALCFDLCADPCPAGSDPAWDAPESVAPVEEEYREILIDDRVNRSALDSRWLALGYVFDSEI